MRAGYATGQWSVQAQHHRATRLCGRHASCQRPLRSVRRDNSVRLTHIPIAFSGDRSTGPMPILKYFLCVGSLLAMLLFGWSAYLEPPTSKEQETSPPAKLPEVFRPTLAPVVVEAEQLSVGETAGPSMSTGRPHHVAKVARTKKKQRTQ